jgi:predicted nucleotidyltransferase
MGQATALVTEAEETAAQIHLALGNELVSCCVYGSTVRGDADEKTSDVNLLIILRNSTGAAHEAIAEVLRKHKRVTPFVLGINGLKRSVRAFAAKFSSILRNYKLLIGEDVLAGIKIEPSVERFLCEQALRNIRLRLGFVYIRRSRSGAYVRFLGSSVPAIFTYSGEALRLEGFDVPKRFEDRIPLMEKEFKANGTLLVQLLQVRLRPPKLSNDEEQLLHGQSIDLIHSIIDWIEKRWATNE